MRKIVIDAQKCVGCGDCSQICPVRAFTLWPALGRERRGEIRRWSLEKRRLEFSGVQTEKDIRKAKQLASRVFAWIDADSCVGCRQCSEICWKEAITVSDA